MLRRLFFFGFLLQALQSAAFSQDKLLVEIDTPAVSVSIDNLDNVYIISEKNELLKFDAEGRFQSSYSNKSLGTGFTVDVSDPLRIVLYSPAFQQLIVLNNRLSEIFTYRFKEINRRISLLAPAENNNGFWVYDENSRQLGRLGRDMRDEYLWGDIFQISSMSIKPEKLLVSGQYVYLYDPAAGLMQFDRFGAYLQFIPEKSQYIQIKDGKLIRMQSGKLAVTDITGEGISFQRLPEAPFKIRQAVLGNNITALRTSKSIFIFRRDAPAKLN